MVKTINYDWRDIEQICRTITQKMVREKFSPEVILAIQRGGLIPSVIISHLTSCRQIETISLKRTLNDEVNALKTTPILEKKLEKEKFCGRKVLLIDDIVGSGTTLQFLLKNLRQTNPLEIKTAILLLNKKNFINPVCQKTLTIDYLGEQVRGWVVFPWEKHEKS